MAGKSKYYQPAARGKTRKNRTDDLPVGTVLYLIKVEGDELWHTSAGTALEMWEQYEGIKEVELWVKNSGRMDRIR